MNPESIEKILLYHMVMYPLRSAGVPENLLWPGEESPDREQVYAAVAKAWPGMANTGFAHMLKDILSELYDFTDEITPVSVEKFEQIFSGKIADPQWPKEVMRRCNIVKVFSSQINVPPLQDGQWDGGIEFTIESSLFNHAIEIKSLKMLLDGASEHTGVEITSYRTLQDAVDLFYDKFDWNGKSALVAWMGSVADFTPVKESRIDRIIQDARAGNELGLAESGLVEAAVIRCMCTTAQKKVDIFQLVYGTQRLSSGRSHPVARALPQFSSTLPYLLNEFPSLHFNILSGYELDEPSLCSLCSGYGNVSLSNFWWHSFFPSVMYHGWHRRLEMCPASSLVGFFSDGWCVEWTWARAMMVRRVMARVLSDKVEDGFYTNDEALAVARRVFFETPKEIFCKGMSVPESIG